MRYNRLLSFCFTLSVLGLIPSSGFAELPCSDFVMPSEAPGSITLPQSLSEVSGLVLSSNPDYLWAHTDSGGEPELYLINRSGTVLRTYRIRNISNVDWEDIAIGPCVPWGEKSCIFIADTGDNLFSRTNKRVLAIEEPDVSGTITKNSTKYKIDLLHTWNIQYPASSASADLSNPDAESSMVRPGSGEIYIVSKHSDGGVQSLYEMSRFGSDAGALRSLGSYSFNSTLNEMASYLSLFNATTSAEFAPNGHRFAIRTYASIYEYDLTAYPNMADAFQHPNERFKSLELQGESVTYDSDGKSFITSGEKKLDPATMNFIKCTENSNYAEPDPIPAPDPLPSYGTQPPPVTGCDYTVSHDYDDSCESDTSDHCTTHGHSCHKEISHVENAICRDKTCYAETCKTGYTPSPEMNTCICHDSYHPYNDTCEADSADNCGSHEASCSSLIANYKTGKCSKKHCVVTECNNGFVPSESRNACICPENTHAFGDSCEPDSVDNCGSHDTHCNAQIQNYITGECRANQCIVTACANGFVPSETQDACTCPEATAHIFEDACETDSADHCGKHDTNCASTIPNWKNGECRSKQCVVTECETGFTPSSSGDSCVSGQSHPDNPDNEGNPDDSDGKSGGDSCSAQILTPSSATGSMTLCLVCLFCLHIARRRRKQG